MRDRFVFHVRGAAVLLACSCAFGNFADANSPAANPPRSASRQAPKTPDPHPWIPIRGETTYVFGPVGDDGYIDYLAALNETASEGVTAENNAAVLLLRAIDLSSIPESDRESLCKSLGIEPSRNASELFKDDAAFLRNQGDWFGETISSMAPWSPADFPPRAKWLKYHEHSLDRAVEATRRSRFYIPFLKPRPKDSAPGALWELSLYGLPATNEIGRALTARALLRLHDGKLAEAEQDLLACHRLARLVASGPFLQHGEIARAIEIKACLAEAALLQYGQLSAAEALAYRAELQKLPPLPSVAHYIGHGHRMLILGFATEQAQQRRPILEDVVLTIAPVLAEGFLFDLLNDQMTVVWTEAMRAFNREWDRWVSVAATPVVSGRRQLLEKLEQEARPILNQKPAELTSASMAEKGLWMGRMFADRLVPAFQQDLLVEDRMRMRIDLVQLGLALAAYRADVGTYPSALEALVLKYCRKIPADWFTAKPLLYRQRSEGYLLYSVGENGSNDAGRTSDARPPGDDIVIEVGAQRPIGGPAGADTRWLQLAGLLLAAAAAIGGLILVVMRMTRSSRPEQADSRPTGLRSATPGKGESIAISAEPHNEQSYPVAPVGNCSPRSTPLWQTEKLSADRGLGLRTRLRPSRKAKGSGWWRYLTRRSRR